MKLKKLLSMLLASLMLMSMATAVLPVTAAEADFPFTDVTKADWAYDSVKYVTENGLMNGTGGTSFTPKANLTRAMVITVLYRLEGSPKVAFNEESYVDVPARQFYSEATAWAFNEGIITGTSTDDWGVPVISPGRDITRQELATMFVRYARFKHVDLTNNGNLSSFKDGASVASWAADAMKWATSVELIKGTGDGTTLSPEGKATREQFATIIHRYCEADFDYELYYAAPQALSTYTETDYPKVENADIYVAVDGDDRNPGTFEKPLATLEEAVKAVRELKKTKTAGGITVAFKAGRYEAPVNLALTAEDSGTAACPITYCAYGDGEVEFNAGVVLPLGEFTALSDAEKEMFQDSVENGIKRIDLTKYGVDVSKLSNANAVFAGDTRIDLARWPNKFADGSDEFLDRFYTTNIDDDTDSITFLPNVKKRLNAYHNIEKMCMYGYYRYDWSASGGQIKSYDPETGTIVPDINGYGLFDNHAEWPECPNPYFYFYNIPDELDLEDEYYIDDRTGVLYVLNPTEDYAIMLTGLMMTLNDVDHLTFKRLGFSYGTDDVLSASNSDYIEFIECRFSHMQDYGILLYGDNNKVYGCEFIDIGARAIEMGSGDRATLTLGNSVIENCLFDGFGTVSKSGHSAVNVRGCGIRIAHNEMCNAPHSAIVYSEYIWASNYITIEYNYIHDVVTQASDAGAIYAGRNPAGHGSVIRYNIIANIGNRALGHIPLGIYLDDGMAGQEIYGNIFYNTANHAVFTNGGRENSFHDNIIISTFELDPKPHIQIGDRGLDPEAATVDVDAEWAMIVELVPFKDALWSARFPELAKLVYDVNDNTAYVNNVYNIMYPAFNSTYNNVIITTQQQIDNDGLDLFGTLAVKYGTRLEESTSYTIDQNPFFAEPATGDYTIVSGDVLDIQFAKIGRY